MPHHNQWHNALSEPSPMCVFSANAGARVRYLEDGGTGAPPLFPPHGEESGPKTTATSLAQTSGRMQRQLATTALDMPPVAAHMLHASAAAAALQALPALLGPTRREAATAARSRRLYQLASAQCVRPPSRGTRGGNEALVIVGESRYRDDDDSKSVDRPQSRACSAPPPVVGRRERRECILFVSFCFCF